jgi:hypothetical protein
MIMVARVSVSAWAAPAQTAAMQATIGRRRNIGVIIIPYSSE